MMESLISWLVAAQIERSDFTEIREPKTALLTPPRVPHFSLES